jgi:hypothetical protein
MRLEELILGRSAPSAAKLGKPTSSTPGRVLPPDAEPPLRPTVPPPTCGTLPPPAPPALALLGKLLRLGR